MTLSKIGAALTLRGFTAQRCGRLFPTQVTGIFDLNQQSVTRCVGLGAMLVVRPTRRHPRLKTERSLFVENTNWRLLLVHVNADKAHGEPTSLRHRACFVRGGICLPLWMVGQPFHLS